MDVFRRPEYEEQSILLRGMANINKEKKSIFQWNALGWGLVVLILAAFFAGVYYDNNAGPIKKYSGGRPKFENYEDYIMTSIISVEREFSLPVTMPTDVNSYTSILPYTSVNTTYSVRKEPEDYDYEGLDFARIKSSNYRNSVSLPKDAKMYKELAAKAEELFDKEIDRRVKEARPYGIKAIIGFAVAMLVYAVAMVFVYKETYKNGMTRLSYIKEGKCLVAKATLIGREKVRRYRRSNSYYVEAENEEGFNVRLRVKYMHYDSFKAKTPCWIIKYPDRYGAYDEYDIVWDGLH